MISRNILDIFESLEKGRQKSFGESSFEMVAVNTLTSKAGTLYERIRYLLDYKEENTIRRSALERILKRLLVMEGGGQVALQLVQELISGGYIPNKTISESLLPDIQAIINKYLSLKDFSELDSAVSRSGLLSLTASEIEDLLYPSFTDRALAEAFYKTIRPAIIPKTPISETDLDIQTYIACERSLLKNDNPTILYSLWLRQFPNWKTLTLSELEKSRETIRNALSFFNRQLSATGSWIIVPKIANYSIYFAVIREIVGRYSEEARSVLEDPVRMKEEVRSILEKKYVKENARIKRSGNRAVVYIFCTKVIMAFLIELPYDYFVIGSLALLPLSVNVLFHPLLLLAVTRTIPKLGSENTGRVISGVESVVQGGNVKEMRVKFEKTNGILDIFFVFAYAAVFAVSFGAIVLLLHALRFNIASITLFLFFLTLVSYFGLRIRHNAKRWKVETHDEGTISLLWNIFTLPIVRAGRWLSTKFSSINVVVFFMDFIIEMPFKLMLSAGDSFLNFLKEKREETY